MKNSDLLFGLMATFEKTEYSVSQLLQLVKPFNMSEASLRTNLSRMSAKEVLTSRKEGKTVFYRFYRKGERIKKIGGLGFQPPSWEKWDNSWWGVTFSVPTVDNEARYKIRKKLIAYRFAPMFSGFWIRPYNAVEADIFNFNDRLIKNHCKVLNFWNYFEMDTSEIQSLWKISEINSEFKKALGKIHDIEKTIPTLTPERALVRRMVLGDEIVSLLIKDPLLPLEYLPVNWKGKVIRERFFELDKKLSRISKPYWTKIFSTNI